MNNNAVKDQHVAEDRKLENVLKRADPGYRLVMGLDDNKGT